MKHNFQNLQINMKALRIFAGSSQEDAASTLHLSRSTYASYESGLRTPDLDTLQKLSSHYHVSLSDLVTLPMEDLILTQIQYQKHGNSLYEILPVYESLSPCEKYRIIRQIDDLKAEELLILSLYHEASRRAEQSHEG